MTQAELLKHVTDELARAQYKFPAFHSGHEGYAVIREELDELWDAIKRDDRDAAGAEAIQVAAMAIRFVLDVCDDLTPYLAGRTEKRMR